MIYGSRKTKNMDLGKQKVSKSNDNNYYAIDFYYRSLIILTIRTLEVERNQKK